MDVRRGGEAVRSQEAARGEWFPCRTVGFLSSRCTHSQPSCRAGAVGADGCNKHDLGTRTSLVDSLNEKCFWNHQDAFFTLGHDGEWVAVAVSHVDDVMLAFRSDVGAEKQMLGSVDSDF